MWILQILVSLLLVNFSEARSKRPHVPPHFSNNDHIMELTPSTFDDFVYGSNYSTIVEFYAPWCGYCQQLAPEYAKAAKKAGQYAQFAAVNCDEEKNKQFCAEQNIKGFPTIITYRPPKTFRANKARKSQFASQPYEQKRDANAMIDAMKGTVKSFAKKLTPTKLEKFFSDTVTKPRVLLLNNKPQVPVAYKSLAVDFGDQLEFVYLDALKNDVLETVQKYLPEVGHLDDQKVIVVDADQNVLLHDGKMNKSSMSKFLSAFATPYDGIFSERHQIIKAIKNGEAKSFKHYKKLQAKKNAKKGESNVGSDEIKKDEL